MADAEDRDKRLDSFNKTFDNMLDYENMQLKKELRQKAYDNLILNYVKLKSVLKEEMQSER